MNHDDAHLLDTLRSALATVAARPDPTDFAALDRAVMVQRERLDARTAPARNTRARWFHHPRVAAAGVVATVLGLGTGVAAASGMPVLREIRQVAHEIGLPVESPAVVDTKQAITALRDALAHDDSAGVRAATSRLRQELRELAPSDRTSLQQDAGDLLREADGKLTVATTGRAPSTTGREGGPATHADDGTHGPKETTTPVSQDDHRSDGNGDGRGGSPAPAGSVDESDKRNAPAPAVAPTTAPDQGHSGSTPSNPEASYARSGHDSHGDATTTTTPEH